MMVGDADTHLDHQWTNLVQNIFPNSQEKATDWKPYSKSTTSIGQQEQANNCRFFTELKAFMTFLELSAQRNAPLRDA